MISNPDKRLSFVTNSVEFQRIQSLPRRTLDLRYEADGGTLPDVSIYFCRPDTPYRFWEIQSAALIEASQHDGLFAPIPVGKGKTLICLALPEVMDSKRAVLLVKPQLRDQLKHEAESFYGAHFELPLDRITVIAYSELSSQKGVEILDRLQPDLVIADEAHCLRHSTAARTKRFLRYMREHPECRFCALSGTMTTRSLMDYGHLLELALRKNSPLPRGYRELQDWAGALDVDPQVPVAAGKLLDLCEGTETAREGYRRRFVQTPGVIALGEDELGTSLVVQRIAIPCPPTIAAIYTEADELWEYEGEVFRDALEHARFLRQISLGFYYTWVWPNGIPDQEWLEARLEWGREVREQLKGARKGLDSPGLLAKAAERGTWKSTTWAAWARVKDRPPPPVKTVWVDSFLIGAVNDWLESIEGYRGIIWYDYRAAGEFVAQHLDLPLCNPERDPRTVSEGPVVASIKAHGDGKNLQMFSRQLFLSLPANVTVVEQAIGRCHRHGQQEDVVEVSWFGHTDVLRHAFDRVLEDARYVEETQGYRQKVLYATKL